MLAINKNSLGYSVCFNSFFPRSISAAVLQEGDEAWTKGDLCTGCAITDKTWSNRVWALQAELMLVVGSIDSPRKGGEMNQVQHPFRVHPDISISRTGRQGCSRCNSRDRAEGKDNSWEVWLLRSDLKGGSWIHELGEWGCSEELRPIRALKATQVSALGSHG